MATASTHAAPAAPQPNPAAFEYSLDRLRRAVHLDVWRADPRRWRVTGGERPHVVVRDIGGLRCDCSDLQAPKRQCKHRLAVLLATGDPYTLLGLRLLVAPAHRKWPARG